MSDSNANEVYDVLIVGGGPAGLSAALVLGRARRRVLVVDSGQYRNAVSRALRGFLTRDGISPTEFREIAHSELRQYPNIELRFCTVTDIQRGQHNFLATISGSSTVIARKVILAVGLKDELPPVEGAQDVYGNGLYHCPYCDGWEIRDQKICVYGATAEQGAGLALELTQWTNEITLCLHDTSDLSPEKRSHLQRFNIRIEERMMKKIEKTEAGICIKFEMGDDLEAKAMFFHTKAKKPNNLAEKLGCEIVDENGHRAQYIAGKTCVTGVYIAGDASRDILQVVAAAGEGSAAAIALNGELLRDDGVL